MKSVTRFGNFKRLLLIDLLPACILVAAFVVISCERDETLSVPAGACNTTNMSYTNDIKPIFDQSCTLCHSASTSKGGVKLDTYADAKSAEADNNKLANSIKPGGSMNQYLSGDTCAANKIIAWADQGAKQ